MKTNRNEVRRTLLSVLLAMIFTVQLAGCGQTAGTKEKVKPWHPNPPKAAQAVPETPTADPVPANKSEVAKPAPSTTVPEKPAETLEPIQTIEPDPEPVQTTESNPEPAQPAIDNAVVELDPASVQGVARLKDMVGCYAFVMIDGDVHPYLTVCTEDEHNPYDLTWRYGPKVKKVKEMEEPDWDQLYRSYVNACDWSLIFDAGYYKKAFPMLAKLYHDNDELLLEHFQTQGVHEGRQANENFNVAAYMANCDNTLVNTFGEDYECYYFYYMLNQDTQHSIDAKNTGGKYPLWLTLELSKSQKPEQNSVTRYRDKVGAQTLTLDPELIALANYRAWYDAEHNMYGHDWITENQTDVSDCLTRISCKGFAENTIKWYSQGRPTSQRAFAEIYANSKSHYDAMVNDKYAYSGYSNVYWSDNPDNPFAEDGGTVYMTQFDVFSEKLPKSPYDPN